MLDDVLAPCRGSQRSRARLGRARLGRLAGQNPTQRATGVVSGTRADIRAPLPFEHDNGWRGRMRRCNKQQRQQVAPVLRRDSETCPLEYRSLTLRANVYGKLNHLISSTNHSVRELTRLTAVREGRERQEDSGYVGEEYMERLDSSLVRVCEGVVGTVEV